MDKKTENMYQNLRTQAVKIFRHNRQGSYATRARYNQAFLRFLRYSTEHYQLQVLSNIHGKHIRSYVLFLQNKNLSAAMIKTDLSAIRFCHDLIPNAKYTIPCNDELSLENRRIGGVDRTWSDDELMNLVNYTIQNGQETYADILVIIRHTGCRINEVLKIDKASAAKALKTGYLHVVGKNGRERDISVKNEVKRIFEKRIQLIENGQKLFIEADRMTHLEKKAIQNYIVRHRNKFANAGRETPMTLNGIRHTFAFEEYEKRVRAGMNEYKARLEVSNLLGHNRDDVTKIYIYKGTIEEG